MDISNIGRAYFWIGTQGSLLVKFVRPYRRQGLFQLHHSDFIQICLPSNPDGTVYYLQKCEFLVYEIGIISSSQGY